MKKKKITKTNAMRILDREKIPYETRSYQVDENDLSGLHVAQNTGQDPKTVFKTLVLKGEPNGYFVCCIPVDSELDLKKAAKASGNKRAAMIHVKELKDVTGYIRGGCSPIGMKKDYPIFLDESAQAHPIISISAGMRGEQILLDPTYLVENFKATPVSITE